jgi:hypothetical protein
MVLATAASVLAQGGRGAPAPPPPLEPGASQADVDRALLAAPPNPNLRNQATVIKWKPDFTYDTLRKGTNRLAAMTDRDSPGNSCSRLSAPASATWNASRRI